MTEPNLKLLEYRLEQVEEDNQKLHAEINEMKKAEKQKLIWGITALGTVVITLAGVIWSYRGVIFK